jgi:hypothetical protein
MLPAQVDDRGYVKVHIPGHPLANSSSRVARHRAVLWEYLGQPETAECHWCGYVLPWSCRLAPWQCYFQISRPQAIVHGHCGINVDHLDGIPGNDWPVNLVPSCWWCNANRQWMEATLGVERSWQIRVLFGEIHPAARPNLLSVFEAITGERLELGGNA